MARASVVAYGAALSTFRAFDFSGGLDLKTAPTRLAQLGRKNKWLLKAKNVVYNTDGSVSKRWGQRLVSADTDLTGGTGGCRGGFRYEKSDGTVHDILAANDGKVYKMDSAGSAVAIKTGLTSTRNYSFAVYNDILHVANGTDAPQQWDGTTWSALGGSSPATAAMFAAHGNRMFATTTAVPSRLYWSKLNNTVDWSGTTDAGFLDVNANDGSKLITLVPSITELVMLKQNRSYRLQGIGPTTGFTVADNLVPATGSVGTNAILGAAFAVNDVFYASPAGVHRLSTTQTYGDLQESFISAPVEPFFRYISSAPTVTAQLDLTEGLVTAGVTATLLYDPGSAALYLAAKAQGLIIGINLLYYDLSAKAWAEWITGNATIDHLWRAKNRTSGLAESEVWMAQSNATGGPFIVTAFDRTATSDISFAGAATAISAQVRHVSNLDAPGVEKSPRRLYLYFAKESGTTTITVNLYADFKTTAVFTTTFDITSSTAESQVIKRIDLTSGITCEYLEVDITQATAGKGFTFYGYAVDFRERRKIRRAE